LVARYHSAIYGLTSAATGNIAEAEDLTQETLIAAYLGLPHLRDPASFGAWLKGIARNLVRMWFRRRATTPALDGGHALEGLDDVAQPLPEERLDQRERLARIRQAVHELSTGNQEVVALRYWAEMSYAEIGETLGVPVSTVKSRLHKAKRQLETQLEPEIKRRIKMIPVTVGEIYAHEGEHGPTTVISLESEDGRSLPIWIGPCEGQWLAVSRVLGGEKLKRPGTYDWVISLLSELGIQITQVVVNALQDTTFYATIHLTQGQTQREIDARPSDAINLALRAGVPVFVAEEVMEAASKVVPDELPVDVRPFELPEWVQRHLSELRQKPT